MSDTAITLLVSEGAPIPAGSGLGFFSEAGFGHPIRVGDFQGRTFVVSTDGTGMGVECDNLQPCMTPEFSGAFGVSGAIIGQRGSGILLTQVPNQHATLNIRLVTPNSVGVQNCYVYANDGVAKSNPPSGLECYLAEIRHQGVEQTNDGLGDPTWYNCYGDSVFLPLIDSPGVSGLRPDGAWTSARQHDWYVAVAIRPTTPGDKQFGFTVEMEYL